MTAVQVRMERRGGWRRVWEVWPALLVAGGSFAATQFVVGNYLDYHLVDIAGGVVSMAAVAALCRVWKPATKRHEGTEARRREGVEKGARQEVNPIADTSSLSAASPLRASVPSCLRASVFTAWLPWLLLVVLVFCWGYGPIKSRLNAMPGALVEWPVPAVHGVVYRSAPVVKEREIDRAVYKFEWLSAAGTGIFIAALLAGIISRMSLAMWRTALLRTASRLRLPLLTIVLILGMGYVTKYSGMDAVLGLAFTRTGVMYPFFAAMLGWLGVALTGSDTASNVMFGSMQKIAAQQGNFNPLLIVTANSTGAE